MSRTKRKLRRLSLLDTQVFVPGALEIRRIPNGGGTQGGIGGRLRMLIFYPRPIFTATLNIAIALNIRLFSYIYMTYRLYRLYEKGAISFSQFAAQVEGNLVACCRQLSRLKEECKSQEDSIRLDNVIKSIRNN